MRKYTYTPRTPRRREFFYSAHDGEHMRRVPFVNGEYYHVYNRGVDKRRIFLDEYDYLRFARSLVAFNDSQRRVTYSALQESWYTPTLSAVPLAHVIAYSLMPNHFHLLLRQQVDGGISAFMQRIGIGYTAYFNKRYDRTGRLFSSTFKSKHVDSDRYLLHLSRYIHLNALDIYQPGWEDDGVRDEQMADKFLTQYRWSSYQHYLGLVRDEVMSNDPDIWKTFKGPLDYRAFIHEWLERSHPRDLVVSQSWGSETTALQV